MPGVEPQLAFLTGFAIIGYVLVKMTANFTEENLKNSQLVPSVKVITEFCSERIANYAFEYAYLSNRKKVTAVHKANILKLAC